MITFPSITSISGWAKNHVQYLGGDEKSPYVLKGDTYYYFSFNNGEYVLFCTSTRDLQDDRK